jgi:hypothetical protein
MNNRLAKLLMLSPLILAAFAGFVALGGYFIMRLWNWLLPDLFGWHTIGFWQALGMLALCRMLFGGLGLAGRGGPLSRRRMGQGWGHMSPEERERFRQRMGEKFGFGPAPGEAQGK